MSRSRPLRSWLYTPGNASQRIAKAPSLGADAVIFDLEDAVPRAEKDRARQLVAEAITTRKDELGPALFVRVNRATDPRCETDVAAVVRPGLAGLRLPKCEQASDVERVAEWIAAAERANGMAAGSVAIVCGIESAAGVWRAMAIATADGRVTALAFGVADFARDLGLTVGAERTETLYARSQLVIVSRVAGIRPPIESVHTDIGDLESLERSTQDARALGFFGRSVIHPSHVPIVNRVFTPDDAELRRARAIVDAADRAAVSGNGVLRMADGEFVDVAIVRRAEDTLRLAAELTEAAR